MSDATSIEKQPDQPIATFIDGYGEERVIHRRNGSGLAVFNGGNTPVLRMTRAAAILIGKRIKARRGELGISQRELCQRAGLTDVNPKQRVHAIENATRMRGLRMGTLYALAYALECDVAALLPPHSEVMALSGVAPRSVAPLEIAS